jgi:hypothetical protein
MNGDLLAEQEEEGPRPAGPPAAAVPAPPPEAALAAVEALSSVDPAPEAPALPLRGEAGEEKPGIQSEPLSTKPAEPRVLESSSIPTPPPVEVCDLDWTGVRQAVNTPAIRARMREVVEGMEALLDRVGGPCLLFDSDRADPADRAIRVSETNAAGPIWIIGDLHGDLLALEAAVALIGREAERESTPAGIIFLGDLFDDEGFGLEVLIRVFEIVLEAPERACVIAGNHDVALSYDGVRFDANVSPADFSEFLNANLAHEWIERAGKLAVRFFARAPRALFFQDGLLVTHGGFPLVDLHAHLAEEGDWNDDACLADFIWTRAHPTARRKLPNRFSRGSQFGFADFAAFCEVSTRRGRPVTHMVRGHDHVEDRWAVYPAYEPHPVLTTVALSRRLPRESFGPYTRVPTVAKVVARSLPQVHRLHIPAAIICDVYPDLRSEPNPAPATDEGSQP